MTRNVQVEGINNVGNEEDQRDLQEEHREETQGPQETTELEELAQVMSSLPNAPDIYTLEAWKDMYGVIRVSTVLNDGDMYIFRTIKRTEYKQLIKNGMASDQLIYEEAIVRKCLLYPDPRQHFISVADAGVIKTLADQILYQSGFVPEQQAILSVTSI